MSVSLITPDRLVNLAKAVERTKSIPGDMAELGVYRGGSAFELAQSCPDKLLHLFDTFTGLPYDETDENDPEGYCRKGMFACPESLVRQHMTHYNVEFHAGLFPGTTEGFDARFSFVHVDCDLGGVAADAIKWFWPRMNEGGIMYFDDYGCKFTGVTRAVDAVFKEIELQYDIHGYQIGALVVK